MNSRPYDTMTTFLQQAIRRGLYLLVIAALTLTACDDDSLVSPDPPADDLFTNYVALGNSITAGFQSGGINVETQRDSYALLLAEAMGTPFNIPALRMPGCPPPFVNILTGERLNGAQDDDCALRSTPAPRNLNNVAVPQAAVLDALSNLDPASNANALTTFILGGRTQVERAAEVNPTFASVWLGNNDVLGAAISGVVTEDNVTSPEVFQQRYRAVLDELEAAGAQGGVLIGVADVTQVPHLSPGVAYFGAQQQGALPETFEVDGSCAPAEFGGVGEQTLVPFGYGFGELLAAAQAGEEVTLNCAEDQRVLSAEELVALGTAVASYNAIIAEEANARGWAFYSPNPTFEELRADDQIPFFPDVQNPAELFGPIFSLDGVHPSSAAHELVAAEVAEAIDATYGTSLAP